MKHILYTLIFVSLGITIISRCSYKKENNDAVNKNNAYNIKYFSKRRWCPLDKNFAYLKPINKTKEELLKNYYKVYYSKNAIVKEEIYKDMDTPHGSWFYYNDANKLVKEILYSNGKKLEEFAFTFDKQGNKTKEVNFVWSPNKKLRVQSLYFYNRRQNKNLLGKIEHYNAGILDEHIRFEYDKQDRLRKKSVFFYTSHIKSYSLYSYNKDNKLIKEEIHNRENKIIQTIKYNYTKTNNGYKKTKNIFRRKKKNNLVFTSETTYLYNGFGLKLKEIGKIGRRRGTVYEFRYSYDADNCKETEKRFDKNNDLIETITY